MDGQRTLLFKTFKHKDLIYTLKVDAEERFPEKKLPNAATLQAQFVDIAENHSTYVYDKLEKEFVLNIAEQQRREWENRNNEQTVFSSITPLAAIIGK
jgi:type I site-specific restriction-modification system R (restriction) subunit